MVEAVNTSMCVLVSTSGQVTAKESDVTHLRIPWTSPAALLLNFLPQPFRK